MTTIPDRNETTEYEELCQQLNFYFSDRAIARWLTENLPEKEWLEEIAISFVHELENDEDTPPDHECKTCGVECTLKDGFKWFREDDTYECATCFDEHFNLPDNENDEMTQSEYREWNRENPELQALGRQVETLEAEQKKLVAYIKEQQDHIKALSARFEAENGKFATADWDTILRSDDTNSGEAPAATQPIPIPSGRK